MKTSIRRVPNVGCSTVALPLAVEQRQRVFGTFGTRSFFLLVLVCFKQLLMLEKRAFIATVISRLAARFGPLTC
ncbi:MAG: hypothetical protein GY888_13650 [Planctomycetaceae bacterium]|nr:hypothetical protein [Planctomycetaceae bacterium]